MTEAVYPRRLEHLPNIGDSFDPVYKAGHCAGLNCHGLEIVEYQAEKWCVLCFSNTHTYPMQWHVVAVIPSDQFNRIVRHWLDETLA